MNKAAAIISAYLMEKEIKHQKYDVDDVSVIELAMSGKNTDTRIRLIATDENNDFKVRTTNVVKVPEEKRPILYPMLNDLNRKYRYVSFAIDDDGELVGSYDVPVSITDECIGGVAFELIIRTSQIVDDAYPDIMKAIWAS